MTKLELKEQHLSTHEPTSERPRHTAGLIRSNTPIIGVKNTISYVNVDNMLVSITRGTTRTHYNTMTRDVRICYKSQMNRQEPVTEQAV